MTYQANAALIDAQWADKDEAICAELTAKVQREFDGIDIPDLIKCEAAENAISTCNGDLDQYHEIYYSSLSQLVEDKVLNQL